MPSRTLDLPPLDQPLLCMAPPGMKVLTELRYVKLAQSEGDFSKPWAVHVNQNVQCPEQRNEGNGNVIFKRADNRH